MNRYLFPSAALFGALMPLVFDSAFKGAVLLATAALVAIAMWRASAAARHLVWLVAIVALLVVPLFSVALPQWRALPQWAGGAVAAPPENRPYTPYKAHRAYEEPVAIAEDLAPEENSASLAAPAMLPVAGASVAPAAPRIPHQSTTWREWLPLAWCAGFAFLTVRLLAAHLLLRRAARHCPALTAPPDEKIAAAFADACKRLGIRQRVTLLLDKKRTIPVVWGVFRPRLMLPVEARKWSDEQLFSVLLHELAHIKRRDTLVQWLTQIACALHWWNPLVWLAAWRLHAERERACDDLVLASGVRPSAYAEHLLNVATRLSPARWTSACGLAMARKSSLEGRLMAVLSEKLNRNGVTRALAIAALVLGAAIALPVAMLRAADAPKKPAAGYPHAADIYVMDPTAFPQGATTYSSYEEQSNKAGLILFAWGKCKASTTSNREATAWTDAGSITVLDGHVFTFLRSHDKPDTVTIDAVAYDLTKGRVILLGESGAARQLALFPPAIPNGTAMATLAKQILALPPVITIKPNATPHISFTNSLGMEFVLIGKADFARNLVRVKEYELFAAAQPRDGKWKAPGFPQTPEHPVVNVTWEDAVAFCEWLTKVEREKGLLKANEAYRLPTDVEWGLAAGEWPENDPRNSDPDSDEQVFPWGRNWPPPKNFGNYGGEEVPEKQPRIAGYRDEFPFTSPVGSFPANALSLFDMTGNVWQWTSDEDPVGSGRRIVRGGAWNFTEKMALMLTASTTNPTGNTCGFRIVKASTASNRERNDGDAPKRAEAESLWDYRRLTEPKLSSPSAAPASPDYRTNVTGELDKDLVDKLESRTRSSIILPDATSKFLTDTKVTEAKERYEAMKRLFEGGSIPSHIFYGAQGSYFEALRGRSVVALGERSAALREQYSSDLAARSTPQGSNAKRENSDDTTGEQSVPDSIKTAVEPGRYKLGGDVNLSVTRQRINGKQHDAATIELPSVPTPPEPGAKIFKNDKGKVVRVDGEKTVTLRQPYKIDRAQGARSWAFAWELDSGILWLSEDGVIRSFYFSSLSGVKVTLFDATNAEQIPSDINGAFKKVFEAQGTASDTVSQSSEKTGSAVAPRLPDIRADLVPIQARQWNEKYAAVAYQTEKDVNFVLIHEGFISTGLSESSADNGKWSIEGNIHLVDAEKTKAAGQNVDKRKVALKYTSDAPGTLILDGKEYDLNTKGRVFILRDQGEPEQLDKNMPLRDKADLEKLGALVKKLAVAKLDEAEIRTAVVSGRYKLDDDVRLILGNRTVYGAARPIAEIGFSPQHKPLDPTTKIFRDENGDVVRINGPTEITMRQGYTIELARGVSHSAFAWEQGSGILWLSEDGALRRFDIDVQSKVKETKFAAVAESKIPAAIYAELTKALNAPRPESKQPEAPKTGALKPADAKIQPGDFLVIRFEPVRGLDGRFAIDADGKVKIPVLGTHAVAGMSLAESGEYLRKATAKNLAPIGILTKVTVAYAGGPNDFVVYLDGEFEKPRVFIVPEAVPRTALAIIDAAGGPTKNGDLSAVEIRRAFTGNNIVENRQLIDRNGKTRESSVPLNANRVRFGPVVEGQTDAVDLTEVRSGKKPDVPVAEHAIIVIPSIEDTRKLKPGESFTLTVPPPLNYTDAAEPPPAFPKDGMKLSVNSDGKLIDPAFGEVDVTGRPLQDIRKELLARIALRLKLGKGMSDAAFNALWVDWKKEQAAKTASPSG